MNVLRILFPADLGLATPENPVYPMPKEHIANPARCEGLPLTQRQLTQLRILLGQPDILEIEYFKRCLLSGDLTIGSRASQRTQEDNRSDCFICYHSHSGGCLFGTVFGFLRVGDSETVVALIRRWVGVESDSHGHQITFRGDNGPWDLRLATSIQCLVGVMMERDRGRAGRVTSMVIGATREVAVAGIA